MDATKTVDYTSHEFILANDKLAAFNIKRLWNRFHLYRFDLDEVFQVARLGIVIASKRFKPELGFQFSTYASRVIFDQFMEAFVERGHLIRIPSYHFHSNPKGTTSREKYRYFYLQACRCYQAICKEVLDRPIDDTGMPALEADDRSKAAKRFLRQVSKALGEDAWRILSLLYLEGLETREVAAREGITRQALHVRLKGIKQKVRRLFPDGLAFLDGE